MKKKLIIIAATLVLLGGIGFGVYRVGMNYASNKMVNTVTKEMQQSGELDKIKKSIKNDPNLKKQMENDPQFRKLLAQSKLGSNDSSNSQSTTHSKENSNAKSSNQGTSGNSGQNGSTATGSQNNNTNSNSQSSAAKLPFNTKEGAAQVLISKVGLSELRSMYAQVKAGTMTKAQVVQILKSRLSPEDITALKLVAYQEANK